MRNELPAPLALADSVVLVTGGTAGVGLAAALKFAASGVGRIGVIGRNAERGRAAKQKILSCFPKALIEFVAADAILPDEAVRAVETATRLLGDVDILVNSTNSMTVPKLFHETGIEEVMAILLQQAAPPILMSRAVLPGMRARRRGVIKSLASDAAKVPTPGEAMIGAGMSAIVRFSTTLALEAKRYGVRVNAITPSLIGCTGSYHRIMGNEFARKLFQKAEQAAHLGLAEPEDVAPLIVFLAGPEAALVTGQVISVNGGISAG